MIKLINISKKYFYNNLYENVNLEIPLNQITFIVGKSGSGKTTLINMIGGLEKPDTGQIILKTENQEIDLQNHKNENLIDFMFQEYNLFPNLTVLQNLKIGRNISGKFWDKHHTGKILKKFDFVDDVSKAKVSELSGGEQQRLSLIRAIERNSKILLIDEPTGNLDEENSVKIFKMLKEMSRNKTIIVVTHDIENANKFADNIFKIENSSIVTLRKKEKNYIVLEEFENKKNKEYLKNKLALLPVITIGDIKKTKLSFLLVFLSIFLMILANIFTLIFYSGIFDLDNNKLSIKNFDVAMISKRKQKFDPNTQDIKTFFKNINRGGEDFSQSDINNLEQNPKIKAIINVPFRISDPQFFYEGKRIIINNTYPKFEEIDNRQYFVNRLLSNNISGNPIQKENEIILGKSFSKTISDNNIIGRSILVNFNIPGISPKTLKIVGINNNSDYNGDYINYIHKNLLPSAINPPSEVRFFPQNQNIPDYLEIINQPTPTITDNNEKIISGTRATKLNDLLISSKLVELWKENNINVSLNTEFFIEYFSDVSRDLLVTGIFQSDIAQIRITRETMDDILAPPKNRKRIYVSLESDIEKTYKEIDSDKIIVFDAVSETKFSVVLDSALFTLISSIGGSLLILLSIFAIVTFAIILIKQKKREILIMKIIGAKLWQLVYYNFGSFMLMLFATLILLFATSFAFTPLLFSNILKSPDLFSIYYDRLTVIIILNWLAAVVILGTVYALTTFLLGFKSYKKLKSS